MLVSAPAIVAGALFFALLLVLILVNLNSVLRLCLYVTAACLSLSFCAAQPAADNKDTPLIGAQTWDAGTVDALQTEQVEHTFTLKNTTHGPITIAELMPSCRCVSLSLNVGEQPVDATTLKPGEQAQVVMSVGINPSETGSVHQQAWVYGPGPGNPLLAALEINIRLHAAVVFSPPMLDFGTVKVRQSHSLTLSVVADKDALADGALPAIISTNAQARITATGKEHDTLSDGKPARGQTYQVVYTARDKAGPIRGALHLVEVPGTLPGLSVLEEPLAGVVAQSPQRQNKH